MASLNKQQNARAGRLREEQRQDYRERLSRMAAERAEAAGRAEALAEEMYGLLPGALQAGISIVEAAELTGISRPTLYRALKDTQQRQDLRWAIGEYEHELARLAQDGSDTVLPAHLAAAWKVPVAEVFERLMQVYRPLASDFASLGSNGLTLLIRLLPTLMSPESEILRMFLLQDKSARRVAQSNQMSETEVLGWAALALLRLLPRMRESAS
jgi:hypothetical protein